MRLAMRNSGCTMDRYGSAWSGAQLQRGQTGHMAAPCHSMAPWARLHVPAIQRTHRRHSLLRTACAAKEDGRDEPSLKGPEDACVSLFPLPESFIRELAAQEGVRVTFQQADPDEDEDDWDEVMSDLSDPWMRSPAIPEDPIDSILPTSPVPASSAQPASAAEVRLAGRTHETQLQDLLQSQPDLVVLDVRKPQEFDQGHIPGSINVPIALLTNETAKALAAQPVLVVASGDHRGSQACVRLTRVHGAQRVWYLEGGLQEWAGQLQSGLM